MNVFGNLKGAALLLGGVLVAGSWGAVADAQTNSCLGNCMASDGPADNPGFHACIRRLCNADHVQPSTHIPLWNGGGIREGDILWAGIDTQDGTSGLYYFCQMGGVSDLMIPGTPPGRQQFALTVDGQTFERDFRTIDNGVTAPIIPDDPLMIAMREGKGVVIESLSGDMIVGLPLIDAKDALEGAMKGCGHMPPDD